MTAKIVNKFAKKAMINKQKYQRLIVVADREEWR